jgi:hypothetical protein
LCYRDKESCRCLCAFSCAASLGAGPRSVFLYRKTITKPRMYWQKWAYPLSLNSLCQKSSLRWCRRCYPRTRRMWPSRQWLERCRCSAVAPLTASHIAWRFYRCLRAPTAISLAEIASIHARITVTTIYQEETRRQGISSRAQLRSSDAAKAAWVSTYQKRVVCGDDAVRRLWSRTDGSQVFCAKQLQRSVCLLANTAPHSPLNRRRRRCSRHKSRD